MACSFFGAPAAFRFLRRCFLIPISVFMKPTLPFLRRLAFGALLALGAQPATAQRLGLELRVDSLLKAMSTEEKLAQLTNNSFMTTPDNARLKIPGFVMDDGPHGVR